MKALNKHFLPFVVFVSVAATILLAMDRASASWRRHTIDHESRGADGVRLADVNGDGLPDIATGWEEGGMIRVCLHPGADRCKSPWPAVTVGRVKSPEDAVLVDMDRDGAFDVVSCCEGVTRTMYVHWAPNEPARYRDPDAWTTQEIPATVGKQMWMFAAPADVNVLAGPDLFVGSKGDRGSVGWLEVPRDARRVHEWRFHQLRRAGWIMSLAPHDMDLDGDPDVVVSDRKGPDRGVFWLENPGPSRVGRGRRWREHKIGGDRYEVMFLDLCDLDQDGRMDVLVATRDGCMLLYRNDRKAGSVPAFGSRPWTELSIPNPYRAPHGKAVRVCDVDLDGVLDIVHTANTQGNGFIPGVAWMKLDGANLSKRWVATDVSRDVGIKFDLIEMVDLDRDGDLDLITCEERTNLGVVWYENPAR